MKLRRILSSSCFLLLSSLPAAAHGGYYAKPPDPPPAEKPASGAAPSGGSKGPARPPSPLTPGPGAPGALGPAGVGAAPSRPLTFAGGLFEPDLTIWSAWWDLNKAPYLELKAHVHAPGVVSGVDGWVGDLERARAPSLQPTEQQVRDEIVPALLKVLEEEQDHDLVSGALIALAKIGNDGSGEEARRFEAAALRLLADDNQEIRETAAVSLGILASPRSIPILANLLWDTESGRAHVKQHEVDYRTRSFAAYGLGLIGARTPSEPDRQIIVAALARALERDRTATPDLGVACLIAFSIVPLATLGPVEPLTSRDDRADPPESSRRAQLGYLLALLDDDERDVRVRAQCPIALARLLAGLPAERHESLRQLVGGELAERIERNRELPDLSQSCILALGEIGTNDGASALDVRIRTVLASAFAEAAETQSRGFALIAMARVGGRPGTGPSATNAGLEPAAEFLIGQLIAGKTMLRSWAGLACGVLGHELVRSSASSGSTAATLERLRRSVRTVLADERDPAKLGAYAIAAGLLRDPESAPLLQARLAKALPDEARGHVATGLALLGQHEARELVRRIVSESVYRPILLRECAIALGVLEDKEVAPLLVRMLEETSSLASQTALATALGFVGDRRSIAPLLVKLVDPERHERARGYAAVALGNAADKERLPWNAKLALGLNYRAATSTLTDPIRGGGILDIF